MRWLVIALLVSVAALLLVAIAVARHVWRQRRLPAEEAAHLEAQNRRLEEALELNSHENHSNGTGNA